MNSKEIIEHYIAAWNKATEADMQQSLSACFSPVGSYTDPFTAPIVGIDALVTVMLGLQKHFPGIVHELSGDIEVHHSSGYYPWIARLGNGKQIPGVDFIDFASDGMISRVVSFTNEDAWR